MTSKEHCNKSLLLHSNESWSVYRTMARSNGSCSVQVTPTNTPAVRKAVMQLLSSMLSVLLGTILGALLVIRWMQIKEQRELVVDRQFDEPCFPPKLTVIEGGLRTGTDR